MATQHNLSRGQGNLFCRIRPNVSTLGSSSILSTLSSRSLTGRGLQIEVHQHHGFRLYIICHPDNYDVLSEFCLEREFLDYRNVIQLCKETQHGILEGMYSCIHEGDIHALGDKFELRFRAPPLQSDYDNTLPRWSIKAIEDAFYIEGYCCNVSSSEMIV